MKRFDLVRLHLTLVLLLGGCVPETAAPGLSGTSREEHPIINGQACSSTEQEAAVALIVDATIDIMGWKLPIRSVMCTGTLIAPDVVLTAAHCAYPSLLTGGMGNVIDAKYHISFTADLTTLVMDATTIMSGKLPDLPQDAAPVSSWVTNPGFSPELLQSFSGGVANLYDVALMFLKTPVTAVQPAVVITESEAAQLKQESVVTISGWGQQTAAAQNPFLPPPAGTVGKKICAQSFVNEVGTHEMQIGLGPFEPLGAALPRSGTRHDSPRLERAPCHTPSGLKALRSPPSPRRRRRDGPVTGPERAAGRTPRRFSQEASPAVKRGGGRRRASCASPGTR